jgi:hypothetical protein
MALTTREITREEWKPYFDDFSRDLADLIATVEVDGPSVGAQIEAERPRLTGISYDDRDDILVIGLDNSGEIGEDLEHVISSPQRIYLASGEGAEMVFDIQDSEGNQTVLRLQPAPS